MFSELSEDLPQLFYFGIAIFQKICGLLHKSAIFRSSKLPKFPLLGPSDSMSIGPSHIPSFVQNVVSRHLPVQRYASNVRQALGHPGFGGRSQLCLIPYTQVSIGLAPLPSNRANSHHQDFTFLGDS